MSKIEKPQRNASVALIVACDLALDTGGALGRLLDFAVYQERTGDPQPEPLRHAAPPSRPVSILVTVVAEVAPSSAVDGAAEPTTVGRGGARIYRFPVPSRCAERGQAGRRGGH